MIELATAAVSALFQVLLFAGLPLLGYLVYLRVRRRIGAVSALRRAGLQLGDPRFLWLGAGLSVLASLVIVLIFAVWQPSLTALTRTGSALHPFVGLGLGGSALVLALIYGVIKTGLAEEVLFRGLIAGALSRRLSPARANLAQALLFLLPHGLLLLVMPELWLMLPVVFVIGLLLGWLRIRSGSILAPWMLHAACNVTMALAIAAQSAVCPAAGCDEPPQRAAKVGRAHLAMVDAERLDWAGSAPRPLATTLWYPATGTAIESRWQAGPFAFGWSHLDAEPASGDPRPLIVLSHGTGGSAAQLSWLAEALVTEGGFIVAAVNHHGNSAAEAELVAEAFVLPDERVRDLSVLIDRLLEQPRFAPLIDRERIGAAGYSLGGYTALALTGAQLPFAQWRDQCRPDPERIECRLPPEARFSLAEIEQRLQGNKVAHAALARSEQALTDERIVAVFLLAPALVSLIDSEHLQRIGQPVSALLGDADRNIDPDATADHLRQHLRNGEVQVIADLGHYAFLAPCLPRGQLLLRSLCIDPALHRRARVHRSAGTQAVTFFQAAFADAASANRP